MLRAAPLACALVLAVGGSLIATQPAPSAPTRALWVTRATLASPDAIKQMVAAASAGGFNTLLVQVRGRGDAYYAGTLEPRAPELASRPDFDPLATVIAQAHAARLQVHAWVAVNLVSSAVSLPASRDHLVYRAPEWLMVPRELAVEMRKINLRSPAYLGRLARWTRTQSATVEGLYTSPIHPAAQDHAAAVIGDIASRYDLDGVHLDYVRFPNEDFDYSPGALDLFKSAVLPNLSAAERREVAARETLDPLAYPSLFPDRWNQFRRDRLTELVIKIRGAVKKARPDAVFSAAVVADAEQAVASRQQDWRGWLDQALLDVVCPMAYSTDPETFRVQISAARSYAGSRPVWAGIGAYQLTPSQTLAHIAAAGKLGAAGIILFSYEAIAAPPNGSDSVSELGRAAFGTAPE
jgi:uncharacterized lipoprotein YddW (UPF0748 family)